MNDVAHAVMDAAERRMRTGGFSGFSFREIAADVGVKSSSVHYHFPTKENLAAAVIRRYRDEVSARIDEEFAKDPDAVGVWTRAFRTTVNARDRMCPCTVLGAAVLALPDEVVAEVKSFFTMCREKMISQGLTLERADELISIAIGGQVVSNALGEPAVYERAIAHLVRGTSAASSAA